MEAYVIARMIGEKPLDYLHRNGYSWTESPAVAKWYHTEAEAEDDREHQAHMHAGDIQVLPYDPKCDAWIPWSNKIATCKASHPAGR